MKNIKNTLVKKLNIGEKVGYFKTMGLIFGVLLIICNVVMYYFLNGVIYFLGLIIGNVVFVWISIPLAIFIGKTYLIDAGMSIVSDVKEEIKKSV